MAAPLQSTQTQYVTASNGVKFAYRRLGKPSKTSGVPLVCHMHFRANMDFWDPLLINEIAVHREVILFDNAGVGRSTGTVPEKFQGWADDVVAFLQALEIEKLDLMGFSLGGVAVQYVALTVPQMIRKLIVAGTRPAAPIAQSPVKEGGAGVAEVTPPMEPLMALINAADPEAGKEALRFSCFPANESGRTSFEAYWQRLHQRKVDGEPVDLSLLEKEGGTQNQLTSTILDMTQAKDPDFLQTYSGSSRLTMPVLIAHGDNDQIMSSSLSWAFFSKTENARLLIYPNAAHSFLWQYAKSFAAQVTEFLDFEILDQTKQL